MHWYCSTVSGAIFQGIWSCSDGTIISADNSTVLFLTSWSLAPTISMEISTKSDSIILFYFEISWNCKWKNYKIWNACEWIERFFSPEFSNHKHIVYRRNIDTYYYHNNNTTSYQMSMIHNKQQVNCQAVNINWFSSQSPDHLLIQILLSEKCNINCTIFLLMFSTE